MILRVPKVNTCFKCGLLVLMMKVVLSASDIIPIDDLVDNVLSVIGIFLLFLSVIRIKHKLITYIAFITLALLGVYTSFRMGNLSIMMSIAICIAAYKQEKKEIIRLLLAYESIFLIIHTILAVITSLLGRENYINISGQWCYTFGFGHPNSFSYLLINVLLMWTWMNFDRLKMRHFLVQFGLIGLDVLFTGTRTAIVIMIVVLLLVFYVKQRNHDLSLLIKFFFPIITIGHFLINYLYIKQSAIANYLNMTLSGRIKLGAYWLERKCISFFGQNVQDDMAIWSEQWQLSGEVPMDNMYNYVIISCGIIWLVVLSVLLYRAAYKKSGRDNIFIILWMLYGIVEIHGLNPIMMFALFLFTGENKSMRNGHG